MNKLLKLQIVPMLLFLMAIISCTNAPKKEAVKKSYEANWESLQNYEVPEWYEDAKFGFWVTWGVYCVPAFKGDHAAEWYGRRMYQKNGQSDYNKGFAQHTHHLNTYGDPSEFGYKDFIPMWKAENFNADKWASLAVKSGAKFFTMMGAHHDNFALWDTKLSKWNSVNMGPKQDLVGAMAKSVRKKGLKFGVSNHTAWNYMFFQWNHINGYDAIDPAYQDLYGNPEFPAEMSEVQYIEGEKKFDWRKRGRDPVKPSERDLNRWIERTKELADMYKPDLYYFDWGFRVPEFETRRQEFGAHYYNKAIEWGLGEFGNPNVVINAKGKQFKPGSAVRDYERGGHMGMADMVWQTDDCVYENNNWSYVPGVAIKPTNKIIDQLMDIISKRGVLMLSFAPKADGSFPDDQLKLIDEMGNWLKINGAAVYNTRPYETFGEVSDNFYEKDEHGHKKMLGTKDDIRFTRTKDNKTLYATFLDWPGDEAYIKTLSEVNVDAIKLVRLLGVDKNLDWKVTPQGMQITLPAKPDYDYAYPIQIEFKNKIAS